jgi:hypothetical protein
MPLVESTDQDTSYTSPPRVLVRFFQRSRDLWKAKYKKLQEKIKDFRTELRDLRRSRDRWRAKAEALEGANQGLRAKLEGRVEQSPPAPSRPSIRVSN